MSYDNYIIGAAKGIIDLIIFASHYVCQSHLIACSLPNPAVDYDRIASHTEAIGASAEEMLEPLELVLVLGERNDDAIFCQNFFAGGFLPARHFGSSSSSSSTSSSKNDVAAVSSDLPRSE